MQFPDTWNDTEKLMLVAVGTLSGHARRMLGDADNRRADERKALAATGEKIRRLREETAKLMSHPIKAAQHLAVGLNDIVGATPSTRLDGQLVRAIAVVAFDGGEAPKLPEPVKAEDETPTEEIVVED